MGSLRPPRPEPPTEVDAIAHQVIGAAIEVHRVLGPGLLEAIYQNAICIELRDRKLAFSLQVPVPILYKGRRVGDSRIDIIVASAVVLELKAVELLTNAHTAQILTYLRATGLWVGLLINFNVPVLKDGVRRFVLTPPSSA